MSEIQNRCCVVGGGPAGVMLGYLLARAGVAVTVLEKHKDFFRDFRGDTVHPSTMQLMKQLGLLQYFLQQPHQVVETVGGVYGNYSFQLGDLRTLSIDTPYIALMPQWDFLNFLSSKAKAYPEFSLRMEHEATGVIEREGCVRGVVVQTPAGEQQIEADLVVACDGRHSRMRQAAALPLKDLGVPIDVLWFRLSKTQNDPLKAVMANINYGKMLILLDRQDYFQAGLIIRKGSFAELQQQGIEQFRHSLQQVAPQLGERVQEIRGWDDVKLLTVQVNRLLQWWRPGLLCIGDAAHAMSPVFGVGINLAIQDAVATANLLAGPLRAGQSTDALLARVQRRRTFPVRIIQGMQVTVHRGLKTIFRHSGPMRPPRILRLAVRLPGLKRLLARVIGLGIRGERVRTPDVHSGSPSKA
jgi:2-polyprenyl-6-methoxyphenol hydroxylase-like FAD-dependent oxidoreductase